MRTGNYPQRPVVLCACVDMQSQRNDPLKRPGGSVSVPHAVLRGPRPPAVAFKFHRQGEGGVLMPGNQPIREQLLVKEGCPEGNCAVTDGGPRNSQHALVIRNLQD